MNAAVLKAFIIVCSILHPIHHIALPNVIYDDTRLNQLHAYGDYNVTAHAIVLHSDFDGDSDLDKAILTHEMYHYVLSMMKVPQRLHHPIIHQFGGMIYEGPEGLDYDQYISISQIQSYDPLPKRHKHRRAV